MGIVRKTDAKPISLKQDYELAVRHDLELVKMAYVWAERNGFRTIPSLEETAAQDPVWFSDIMTLATEVDRQINYIDEGE